MKTHRLCVLLNRGEAGIQDRAKNEQMFNFGYTFLFVHGIICSV